MSSLSRLIYSDGQTHLLVATLVLGRVSKGRETALVALKNPNHPAA